MVLFFLVHAFANESFTLLKQTEQCTIRKREKTAQQGAAMWARCTWRDTDPAVVAQMLADVGHYNDWIWPIGESRIERTETTRALVYQRQHIWGLSDREVLLWVTREASTPDRMRLAWTTAEEEPLTLTDGGIRTPRNIGHWRVEPNPSGPGALVEHQIEVDAGGLPLPGWLVRAIQTRGFNRILSDAHEHALAQATKP